MQNSMLAQKLYQVCLSHDHLCATLRKNGTLPSKTDQVMMETTERVVAAKTTEEIETIYSEQSGKLLGSSTPSSAPITKVFFFPKGTDISGKDLIEKINKMIADIDAQIDEITKEGKGIFGDEFDKGMDAIDDQDLPEDDLDRTDDLKPPF